MFARELHDSLESRGYSVFLDQDSVRLGESVRVAIERALYSSQVFLPVFDSEIDMNANLFFELGLFMGLKRDEHKIIPIVTERFDFSRLPPELASIQFVRWGSKKPDAALDQLIQLLGKPTGRGPQVEIHTEPSEKQVSIELTIEGDFEEFTIEKQEEIIKQIQKLLDNNNAIRIQSRREG